jgi:L-lactate dehydrogenase complex protein LldE
VHFAPPARSGESTGNLIDVDGDVPAAYARWMAAAPSRPEAARGTDIVRAPAMRAALFITCFNDTLFPGVGQATVEVLERVGCTVDFPEAQTCCGQMHANTGYQLEALPLARRFVRVFADAEAIVCPSASCAGMVREAYPRLARLAGDDALARDAAALVPRVYELTEFLTDVLGVEDVGASFPHRVTYHPTCHSLRGLHVGDRPLRLLRAVHGIDLVELGEAEECCGFGGTFAVKNADTSIAMLTDKLRHVLDTRAEVCTAADASCLMHIGGALRRQRSGTRTLHLAEILAAQE